MATLYVLSWVFTFRSSPARQLTSKLDTNVLGSLQFPRKVGHDIDSISAAHSDCDHPKATGSPLAMVHRVKGKFAYPAFGV